MSRDLTTIFVAIFALAERLPNSASLTWEKIPFIYLSFTSWTTKYLMVKNLSPGNIFETQKRNVVLVFLIMFEILSLCVECFWYGDSDVPKNDVYGDDNDEDEEVLLQNILSPCTWDPGWDLAWWGLLIATSSAP